MKKRIAALAAAVIALQTMAVGVSAAASGTYYLVNGVYYSDWSDAQRVSNGYGYTVVDGWNIPNGASLIYYSSDRNKFYTSQGAAEADGAIYINSAYRLPNANVPVNGVNVYNYSTAYNSTYRFYSRTTNRYYPSYAEALAASNYNSANVYEGNVNGSSTSNGWYNSITNKVYTSYEAACNAAGGPAYVTWRGGAVSTVTPTNVRNGLYYVAKTETYFTSYASALAAANGDTSQLAYIGYLADECSRGVGTYFSSKTQKYYPNYASALYASNYDVGSVTPVGANGTVTNTPGYTYVNGRWYYNGVATNTALADPYVLYQNKKATTNNNNKTTTKANNNVEVEDGTPYINGGKSYNGTNGILRYVQKQHQGDTIYVQMNGCNVIDKEILKYIKGIDVEMVFVLKNGARWSINGLDVKGQPKDMSIVTEYNIKYIPASVSESVKAKAVSTSQVGLSNNFNALQVESDVTLKLSKKRAGYTATLYRYDQDSQTLSAVGKTTISSSGTATFSVTDGGAYLVAIS